MARRRPTLSERTQPSATKGWDEKGPLHEKLERYISLCLHSNFKPHPGQQKFIQAVLPHPRGYGIKRGFLKPGRKFGKSTSANYIAHRFALYYPNKRIYLLAPEQKQAAEIYWHSGDLPNFLHIDGNESQLVESIDNQGFRKTFINGSFIKVDGSDNYDAQRGYNPDVIIADEFADFDPRWWGAVVPNLISRGGWLILMGTPPREPLLPDGSKHLFVQILELWTEEMKRTGKTFVMTGTSYDNPNVDREALDDEIRRLESIGDHITVRREYFGEVVFGGPGAIFPMVSKTLHFEDHEKLLAKIRENPSRYERYLAVDPGTVTVFAGLFCFLDRYTATPYLLDCIYQTRPEDCSVDTVVPLLREKAADLGFALEDFQLLSDNAAQWFIVEASQRYGLGFAPTMKQSKDKQDGISLIKDILGGKRQFISSRCEALYTEMQNYRKNERGVIVKEWDHLIDLFRYILKFSAFTLNETKYETTSSGLIVPRRPPRGYTFAPHEDDVTIDSLLFGGI